MKKIKTSRTGLALTVLTTVLLSSLNLQADELNEFVVYGVRTKIPMGNPTDIPLKDYYINLGTKHGVRRGSKLEVRRRLTTYDLINRKLHQDTVFGIAEVLVIHADEDLAIARLSKVYPEDQIPLSGPQTVMIGDLVKVKK